MPWAELIAEASYRGLSQKWGAANMVEAKKKTKRGTHALADSNYHFPLLVLRAGYMARYDGPGPIAHGGAYPQQNGTGDEIFNFKPYRQTCYGYGYSPSGMTLDKLAGGRHEVGDKLIGVDVVFVAKRPKTGQVVVGWYRNATVFHKQLMRRPLNGYERGIDKNRTWFCCMADAASAILLPENERTFEVPYAPAGNPGFLGKSQVWYPSEHLNNPRVRDFVKKLRAYIDKNQKSKGSVLGELSKDVKSGKGGKPNHERNIQVEKAAIEAATKYYQEKGYSVTSVEPDKLGWDLEAIKNGRVLYVEVKGLSGSLIDFELTPNEYRRLKENFKQYRVCVVCEALSKGRIVYELKPSSKGRTWKLSSFGEPMVTVSMTEKPGAVCRETGG